MRQISPAGEHRSVLHTDGRWHDQDQRRTSSHSIDGRDQGDCARYDVAEGTKLAIRHIAELLKEDRQEAERREWAKR